MSAVAVDDTRFDRVVIEGFLKLLPRAVQARHHGADGDAKRLRRVLVGKPLDVDQEDNLSMQRRQLLDCTYDLSCGELVQDIGFRPRAFIPKLVVEDELADVVEADVFLPGALEAVPEEVAHDREEPRLHVRALLVAVLVTKRAEVGFLDQVLRLIRVASEPKRASVKGVEMC